MRKQIDVFELMRKLSVPQQYVLELQAAPSFDVAESRFKDIQKQARISFRKKALELHPDINHDPKAESELKDLSGHLSLLEKIKLPPLRPKPVMVQIINVGGVNWYSGGTTASTTTTGGW